MLHRMILAAILLMMAACDFDDEPSPTVDSGLDGGDEPDEDAGSGTGGAGSGSQGGLGGAPVGGGGVPVPPDAGSAGGSSGGASGAGAPAPEAGAGGVGSTAGSAPGGTGGDPSGGGSGGESGNRASAGVGGVSGATAGAGSGEVGGFGGGDADSGIPEAGGTAAGAGGEASAGAGGTTTPRPPCPEGVRLVSVNPSINLKDVADGSVEATLAEFTLFAPQLDFALDLFQLHLDGTAPIGITFFIYDEDTLLAGPLPFDYVGGPDESIRVAIGLAIPRGEEKTLTVKGTIKGGVGSRINVAIDNPDGIIAIGSDGDLCEPIVTTNYAGGILMEGANIVPEEDP